MFWLLKGINMSSSLNKNDVILLKWLLRQSKNGGEVYQSMIPVKTKLNPRVVSKVLNKLEKIGVIERVPIIYNKRKTYIVKPNVEIAIKVLKEIGEDYVDIDEVIREVLSIPCISCPQTEKCYEGGFYDPVFCPLLTEYIKSKTNMKNKEQNYTFKIFKPS
jgi:DNA-binding Lrp family transcriptional regulator